MRVWIRGVSRPGNHGTRECDLVAVPRIGDTIHWDEDTVLTVTTVAWVLSGPDAEFSPLVVATDPGWTS